MKSKIGLITLIGAFALTLGLCFTAYAIDYVCVDPGHGGDDPGTHGRVYGYLESMANLKVGLALRDTLLNKGYPDSTIRVTMTRTTDTTVYNTDRARMANGTYPDYHKADQLLCIHHNASDSIKDSTHTTNGTESWWSSCNTTSGGYVRDNRSYLAQAVQGKMVEKLGWKNRGIKDLLDTLTYLHSTTMISTLPEISFITCKTIDSLFTFDTTYARKEAGSVYRGWRHYIENDLIITIQNHFGGLVTIDGVNRESPYYGAYCPGEYHTIRAFDQWWEGDIYYYCKWWDGFPQEHGISVGYVDQTHTAYHSYDYYYVNVDVPNGGESYGIGQNMHISWTADPGVNDPPYCWWTYVDIFLSRDGGSTFNETIVTNYGMLGLSSYYYDWTVTSPMSNQCRIKIVAHDDACNQDYDVSNANFTIACAAPNAPSNLTASNSASCNALITLNWQDNSSNEEGFNIYRDGQLTGSVSPNVTTFSQSGLNPGQTYSYYVRSQRQGCESGSSNTVNSTPGPLTPAAPTNLQVVNIGECVFRATWQDNSNNEDGFALYNGPYQHALLGPNVTSFQGYWYPESEWGQQGNFVVYAYDGSVYGGCEAYSNHVIIDPPGGVIPAPSDCQLHGPACNLTATWHNDGNYDFCEVKHLYTGCDVPPWNCLDYWYQYKFSSACGGASIPHPSGCGCVCAQVRGGKGANCGGYGNKKWSGWSNRPCLDTVICRENVGCPYLFVPDDEGFVGENTILAPTEMAKDRSLDVNDYYLIKQSIAPVDNMYKLRIAEFEQEHSFFDQVELLAVDHDFNQKVAVTKKGDIFVYDPSVFSEPISCYDEKGVNQDSLLQLDLEDQAFLPGSGSLILDFGSVPQDSGNQILLLPCCGNPGGIPKNYLKIAAGSEPSPQVGLLVEAEKDGIWQQVDSIPPRMAHEEVCVNLSDLLKSDEKLKIKLSWDERGYGFSKFRCFRAQRIDKPNPLDLIRASHSTLGEVTQKIASDDNEYVEFLPSQNIDLNFSYIPPEENKVRDFIFKCNGYYVTENSAKVSVSTPDSDKLQQNYPNPFNPQTQIEFSLKEVSKVSLVIYNLLGQKVITLVDEMLPPGKNTNNWNGKDESGKNVASGIYFYRLQVGELDEVRKMILMK